MWSYWVISNTDLTQFQNDCAVMLNQGWSCQGGITMIERLQIKTGSLNTTIPVTTYYQAFTAWVEVGDKTSSND
jgi:murein L,D-transpeptidase YcbB/YkuD